MKTSEVPIHAFCCPAEMRNGVLIHTPWCDRAKELPGKECCLNASGLHPIGHAILVFPYEPEITKSAIYIPPTIRRGTAMVEARAVVIEVGPSCWPGEPPRCVPGDKVMIGKYCGAIAQGTKDDKIYRMVNADDVYCRIED